MKIALSAILLFVSTSVLGGEIGGVFLGTSCAEVIRLETERGSKRRPTELEGIFFELRYQGANALVMYSCDEKKQVQSIALSVFFNDPNIAKEYFLDQSSLLTKELGNPSFDLQDTLQKKGMKKSESNDRLWCPKGESLMLSVSPFGPGKWQVSKNLSSHTAVCNLTPSSNRPATPAAELQRYASRN